MTDKYESSSVGRAPRPSGTGTVNPAQDDTAKVEQNGPKSGNESDRVQDVASLGKEASSLPDSGKGMGENSGVVGSSPASRTNLLANETPDWLAKDMALLANIYPGMRVLEPSAGRGNLVKALHRWTQARVVAIEINSELVAELRETNAKVQRIDFLQVDPYVNRFERIVMNPPIMALPHVLHAFRCLERGGRMVALLHRRTATLARMEFDGYPITTYRLPLDTFQFNGQQVAADIFVLDKL